MCKPSSLNIWKDNVNIYHLFRFIPICMPICFLSNMSHFFYSSTEAYYLCAFGWQYTMWIQDSVFLFGRGSESWSVDIVPYWNILVSLSYQHFHSWKAITEFFGFTKIDHYATFILQLLILTMILFV
jgi:hypothetical protein